MPLVIVNSGSPSGNPAAYTGCPTLGSPGCHARAGRSGALWIWISGQVVAFGDTDDRRVVALGGVAADEDLERRGAGDDVVVRHRQTVGRDDEARAAPGLRGHADLRVADRAGSENLDDCGLHFVVAVDARFGRRRRRCRNRRRWRRFGLGRLRGLAVLARLRRGSRRSSAVVVISSATGRQCQHARRDDDQMSSCCHSGIIASPGRRNVGIPVAELSPRSGIRDAAVPFGHASSGGVMCRAHARIVGCGDECRRPCCGRDCAGWVRGQRRGLVLPPDRGRVVARQPHRGARAGRQGSRRRTGRELHDCDRHRGVRRYQRRTRPVGLHPRPGVPEQRLRLHVLHAFGARSSERLCQSGEPVHADAVHDRSGERGRVARQHLVTRRQPQRRRPRDRVATGSSTSRSGTPASTRATAPAPTTPPRTCRC